MSNRTYDKTEPFPLDWDQWRKQWQAWRTRNSRHLGTTTFRFPGKNILADEVLGTWEISGRMVELSEVVFPSFERDGRTGQLKNDNVRGIGITFGIGSSDSQDGTVVHSFGELERVLGVNQ